MVELLDRWISRRRSSDWINRWMNGNGEMPVWRLSNLPSTHRQNADEAIPMLPRSRTSQKQAQLTVYTVASTFLSIDGFMNDRLGLCTHQHSSIAKRQPHHSTPMTSLIRNSRKSIERRASHHLTTFHPHQHFGVVLR